MGNICTCGKRENASHTEFKMNPSKIEDAYSNSQMVSPDDDFGGDTIGTKARGGKMKEEEKESYLNYLSTLNLILKIQRNVKHFLKKRKEPYSQFFKVSCKIIYYYI